MEANAMMKRVLEVIWRDRKRRRRHEMVRAYNEDDIGLNDKETLRNDKEKKKAGRKSGML